jgi:RNA polymerase I-specific transcription initiation factor RRN6
MPFTHPVRSDPLTRLSKRLRNKDPSKDLGVIPPTISQHLTHWQFGKHPSTYDWLAAEQALQAEEDLDEQSQQQLEKERRKKERREKRQQRENELMRAKVESQPAVFPRSSPGPTFSGMASSSQVLSQAYGGVPFPKSAFGGGSLMVPQSQLEPGKFGGRPDKKKKKKGRISGF